jgi:hypothetical protein
MSDDILEWPEREPLPQEVRWNIQPCAFIEEGPTEGMMTYQAGFSGGPRFMAAYTSSSPSSRAAPPTWCCGCFVSFMSDDPCKCPKPDTCWYCSRMYPCDCAFCPYKASTDGKSQPLHQKSPT